MSAVDRVRTATEATAGSVGQIRPLTLPEEGPAAAGRRGDRKRWTSRTFTGIRQNLLVPLSAAALVIAVAVSLVVLRHTGAFVPADPASASPSPASPASPAALAGIPRYYAFAVQNGMSHAETSAITVTITDVRTGKAVASATLPATSDYGANTAIGITAAGDDRSFIAARRNGDGDVDYFLVRLAPGTARGATAAKLPIPISDTGDVLSLAASPDGQELAVLSARGNGTTVRVYSVTSGATLRSWNAASWHYDGNGGPVAGISWTADGQRVAFSTETAVGGPLEERVISMAAPSGDLTASKLALKAPASCMSLLLTPDGGTVVCGAGEYDFANRACGENGPMYVAYSAVTGQQLRVLSAYAGACGNPRNYVLWTDDSARHVAGESVIDYGASPKHHTYTDQYGVITGGTFGRFRDAHGQGYSGPAF